MTGVRVDPAERAAAARRPALADAWLAARLFAFDPAAIGGIVVRAAAGPVRDRWLADLRGLLPAGLPWRVAPLHVDAERLLGGLDLAATLQCGRPVASRGLLAEAHGGVLLLPMAERTAGATVAQVAAALDRGEVACARHGIETTMPARFGVVAFDESDGDDAPLAAALLDRLALVVDLRDIAWRDLADLPAPVAVAGAAGTVARRRPGGVDAGTVEALCAAASALGIDSIRASLLAVRVAGGAAAARGAEAVSGDDAATAARLVLAPRATQRPLAASGDEPPPQNAPDDDADAAQAPPPSGENTAASEAETSPDDPDDGREPDPSPPLDDIVLAAAAAAIPARLLERLAEAPARGVARGAGRAGAWQASGRRGRPAGIRRARPGGGARLDVIATLRAAAPWQRVRGRATGGTGSASFAPVRIRADDFHVARFIQRGRTTTIFAVDASGSAALHRLAETKGAVELLLADCYVRRDSVAVIAFRGRIAELLLPPTRSLVRAKRSLAGLAGGGGTPLGAGIDAAAALADSVRRRGDTPVVVVLSDGRANVGRDGAPGRTRAEADALAAARALRARAISVLFIDTSPQPQATARDLAAAMGARYVPLPHAEANALSAAVRAGTAAGERGR